MLMLWATIISSRIRETENKVKKKKKRQKNTCQLAERQLQHAAVGYKLFIFGLQLTNLHI